MRVYKQNTINHSFHLIYRVIKVNSERTFFDGIKHKISNQWSMLPNYQIFSKFLTVNYLASISILEIMSQAFL